MSFPRYPKYKPSGTDWLGDVPAHWEVISIKHRFRIYGGATPKSENEEYWDGNILWATPADLSKLESLYISDTQRKITESGLSSCNTALAPAGSIVLSTRAPIGSLAITTELFCTNQGCKTLVPSNKANSKFFAYFLSVSTAELNMRGRGTTFLELSGDELGAFKVPLPPLPEQTQIANFLDRETAKIDALVSEQRRLIELLKEKRQAVISHAVTRGLNPSAPLKPSGIDWLGDVPEHWEIKALRMIAIIVRGASPRPAGDPKYFGGDVVPWVTVAEITKDNSPFLIETETFLTEEGAKLSNLFKSGTLIYSNSGATLGVPKILQIDACANDGVIAFLNLSEQVLSLFLYQYLGSITEYIREKVKQGSGQPNLNTDIVKSLKFALPPINEQADILNHLDAMTAKFDALTSKAERAIILLQERRTALISATVTGQIDLKNYFHPQMMQTSCR